MGDMADYYVDQMASGKMSVGGWPGRRKHEDSYVHLGSETGRIYSRQSKNQKEIVNMTIQGSQVSVISTVGVKFLQGNTYSTYSFFTDLELAPEDIVVVDTSNGPALARVDMMEKGINPKATKWVIDRVDMEAHEYRMAREKMEKELRKQLEKRRKELTDIEVYKQLAEKDEEMKTLLEAYQQVQAGTVTVQQLGAGRRAVIPPRRQLVQEMHARAVERASSGKESETEGD
jgi:hypothetical protein